MIQPLWRTVWRFLKKLKIELPYNPAIPLPGIYPEKTIIQKESCTTMFIAALFTAAIMAITKKSTNNKCWRGCVEKATLLHCWWECKLVQPLWRTVWSFLKKIKIGLPYDPAIPHLGIYLKKTLI